MNNSFWLELNLNPENYRNVNELASDIIALVKGDGIPVRVYTTYTSVMKHSINHFMCKEFHFDYRELFSAIVKAGLRITSGDYTDVGHQVTLCDYDGMYKIRVKKANIYKYDWDGYGMPPEYQWLIIEYRKRANGYNYPSL